MEPNIGAIIKKFAILQMKMDTPFEWKVIS